MYSRLAALDILDYTEHTLWSGSSQVDVRPRKRLIGEAGRLEGVPDGVYDALLASHVLEHLANPLGALAEWQRAVRPGGHVLLIMPHRDGTFDHRRPVTSLDHLQADANHGTGEDDRTHFAEILALHDLERDPSAPDRQLFEQRCRENPTTRAMHHHVFVSWTVVEMCRAAGMEVLMLRPALPCHIVCLCRPGPGSASDTELDDQELLKVLSRSPFASDRSGPPSDASA